MAVAAAASGLGQAAAELRGQLLQELERVLLVLPVLLERLGSVVVTELLGEADQRAVHRELVVLGADAAGGVEEVAQRRLLHVPGLLVVLLEHALRRGVPRRRRLRPKAAEHLLEPRGVAARLAEMRCER